MVMGLRKRLGLGTSLTTMLGVDTLNKGGGVPDTRLLMASSSLVIVEGDSIAAQVDGRSMAGWLSVASNGLLSFAPNDIEGTEGTGGDTFADVQGDIAAVLAEHAGITHIFLHIGTNDLGGVSTPSTMLAALESIVDDYNAGGVHVIYSCILPRTDAIGVDPDNEQKRVDYNALAAAITGRDLTVVNHDANFVTGTMLQADGVHPNPFGESIVCANLVAALRFQAVNAAALLPANALVNPTFTGTAGTIQTGFQGGSVAPTSWSIDNDTGATVTAAIVVDAAGDNCVQFDVSGAASVSNASLRLYRNATELPLEIGQWCDGAMHIEIAGAGGAGDPIGLNGWDFTIGDAATFSATHNAATYGQMSKAVAATVRCLPSPETVASTFQQVAFNARFAVGTVAARIRLKLPHAAVITA